MWFSIKCYSVNIKYEADCLNYKCVSWHRLEFSQIKNILRKMTAVASLTNVYVMVDQAAKITVVTDLALIIQSLALNQDIFCQTHFFRELFLSIVCSGKLHYCDNTYWRPLWYCRMFNQMENIFRLVDSAFLQLCCLKFLCK